MLVILHLCWFSAHGDMINLHVSAEMWRMSSDSKPLGTALIELKSWETSSKYRKTSQSERTPGTEDFFTLQVTTEDCGFVTCIKSERDKTEYKSTLQLGSSKTGMVSFGLYPMHQ